MTTSPQVSTSTAHATASNKSAAILGLCVVGAALMVVSGAIHLHLWNEYYRHIKTGHMNVLFLVQLIAAFVGALALLVFRNWLFALAGAALMAGTAVGYLIARYHSGGLFGFALPSNFSSSDSTWSLTVEIIATVLLLGTAAAMLRRNKTA